MALPTTSKGQAAAGRIAEFRQNIDNGATPAEARSTVRAIEAGPLPTALPATQPTAPVMDANIPVASMDNNNTGLQMPEMGDALEMNPAAPAIESGNAFLDAQTRSEQETVNRDANAVTQVEQRFQQLFGLAGQESADRTMLEQRENMPGMRDAQRRITSDIINQTNQLRQFDNSNVIANEQMRIDASKRDITKRTYGAMSAEANLQNAVKRSGIVASIYATQSAGMLLQGNIAQAAEFINSSLESYYEPIRREMEMTKFFLERNDKQLTASQSRLAGLELKQIDVAQREIDRAMDLTDAAVASGYASEADIKNLSSLSGNPEAQVEAANMIIATGRRAMVAREQNEANLRMQQIRQSMAATGETGTTNESIQLQGEKNADIYRHMKKVSTNTHGLRLLTAGGLGYGISSFIKGVGTAAFGGAIAGGVVGSVVPGAGTVAGAAVGFTGGTVAGGSAALVNNAKAKEDALASLNYLLQNASFQSLRDMKTSGITFGALSNAERTAAGAAANAVAASLEIDPATGQPTGIIGSYENFQANMAIVESAMEKSQNRLLSSSMPEPISQEVDTVFNQ